MRFQYFRSPLFCPINLRDNLMHIYIYIYDFVVGTGNASTVLRPGNTFKIK